MTTDNICHSTLIDNLQAEVLLKRLSNIESSIQALQNNKESKPEHKPISKEAVMKMFNVSSKTLYNWNKQGILTCCKIGTRVIYYYDEVVTVMNLSRKGGRQ